MTITPITTLSATWITAREEIVPVDWDVTRYRDPAVIVDIDGTLAHRRGRSPYDYDRVKEDVVDNLVRWQIEKFIVDEVAIILCSGRPEKCREDTEDWLNENNIQYDQLLMRPTDAKRNGNQLPDWIVKYGLFDTYIRNKYSIIVAIDDRNQVVQMWRELGLRCWQVADGNF